MLGDAADDVAEQLLVGLAVIVAVDLAAEPVVQEFADHRFGAAPGFSSS